MSRLRITLSVAALLAALPTLGRAQNAVSGPVHTAYTAATNTFVRNFDVAVNRSGDGVLVRCDRIGALGGPGNWLWNYQIVVQRTRRGVDFGSPIVLPQGGFLFAESTLVTDPALGLGVDAEPWPRCTIDDRGTIAVVWEQIPPGGGFRSIYACAVDFASGNVSNVLAVESSNYYHALQPDVAIGPELADIANSNFNGAHHLVVVWTGNWEFLPPAAPGYTQERGTIKYRVVDIATSPALTLSLPSPCFSAALPTNVVSSAQPTAPGGGNLGAVAFPQVVADATGRVTLAYAIAFTNAFNSTSAVTPARSGYNPATSWQIQLRQLNINSACVTVRPMVFNTQLVNEAPVNSQVRVDEQLRPSLTASTDHRVAVAWSTSTPDQTGIRSYLDVNVGPPWGTVIAPITTGSYGASGSLLSNIGHPRAIALSNQGNIKLVTETGTPGIPNSYGNVRLRDIVFTTGGISQTAFGPSPNDNSPVLAGFTIQGGLKIAPACATSDTGEVEVVNIYGTINVDRARYDANAILYRPYSGPPTTGPSFTIDMPARPNESFAILVGAADYGQSLLIGDGRHAGYDLVNDPVTPYLLSPNPFLVATGTLDSLGRSQQFFTNLPFGYSANAFYGVATTTTGALPASLTAYSQPKSVTITYP